MRIAATLVLLFGFTFLQAQLFHEDLVAEDKYTFQEIVELSELHFDEKGRERGLGYKQFQRWKYWAERNLDENGKIRKDENALNAFNKFIADGNQQKSMTGVYEEMGPLATINTSTWSSALGRISAIGIDGTNDSHLIAGSPTGGIWKTTDYGDSWTALFDDALLMDVYSLEISHANSDHYYAGLNGKIVKSTDGGTNWNDVNISTTGLFNTIEMHPDDANLLFAVNQSNGQILRSVNGGNDFTTSMDHNSSMYDLEFHPTDINIVYASGNDAVYKSTDGGANFSEITSGPWSGSGNAIMMAITPIESDYLYALEEVSGGFNALYLSEDEGVTWSTLSDNSCGCQNIMGYDQNGIGGQAPRDMDVIVSPIDADIVHVAGTETWRTVDAGQTWVQTTEWNQPGDSNFIHADIDMLIYDNDRIIAGTDGGIYFSTTDGLSWTDITSGIGVRQFYRIGASQTEIDRVSGGSQDNGTGVLKSGDWYDFAGADGMETFIDWNDEDNIYSTIQFGALYKSTNGGQSLTTINTPAGSGNWVTPLEQDPIVSTTIYTARTEIWKSTDSGINWTAISDFTNGQSCDELKIAPSDNNYIYASYDETIYSSSDAGANWSESTLSISSVNYISVHPTNPERLAITVSGSGSKVFESMDAGASWTDITANIPNDVSIECVLYDQAGVEGLYVGGNPGIYNCLDTSNPDWESILLNLPRVRVTELEIRNNTMYVGTYGRGLWKYEIGCEEANPGDSCDDGDDCTINDAINVLCECTGTYVDADKDGFCLFNDPDDTDPCVPVDCPPCTEVTLTITLDNYPEETTWEFVDDNGNVVFFGGPYGTIPDGTTITEMECLVDGCYDFIIYDSYGDGICCGYGNGSYTLTETVSGIVLASGGEFGDSETTNFCVTAPCEDEGLACDDGDGCTVGEVYDADCNCVGGVYTDNDNDNVCIGDDPDDNDPCIPDDSGCASGCEELDNNNVESGWGIWNDGGADAAIANYANYANSGTHSLLIKDNNNTSVITTDVMDYSIYAELVCDFNFIAIGFNNSSQDFWLQISTDGGSTFTNVAEWVFTQEFQNNVRVFENIILEGPFTSNTVLRFRCDANANNDKVYIDDVIIEGCESSSASCSDGILNGGEVEIDCGGPNCSACVGCFTTDFNDLESSWGIWSDGGADCRRNSLDQAFANSGVYCVRIQDDTDESTTTTENLDMSAYSDINIEFSYITSSIESGEGFLVQYSTDGGASFTDFGSWTLDTDFVNGVREDAIATVSGPFTADTQLRIRANGSNNSDRIYIDDIKIEGCYLDQTIAPDVVNISRSSSDTDLSFTMMPNPVSTSQTLSVKINSQSLALNMSVFDLYGQLITRNEILDSSYDNYELNIKNLSEGTYIIRIDDGEDFEVKKFIVVR